MPKNSSKSDQPPVVSQGSSPPGWQRWAVVLVVLFIAVAGAWKAGMFEPESLPSGTWTCPMHPSVVAAEPGTCPICGMYLVHKAPGSATPTPAPQAAVPPAPMLPATPSTAVPAVPTNHADASLAAYDALYQALVAGDAARASTAAAHLAGTVANETKLADALREFPARIGDQRLKFPAISEAMIARAATGKETDPKLHVIFCPMAKARWLQPKGEVRNPYYGEEMRTCGVDQGEPAKAPKTP